MLLPIWDFVLTAEVLPHYAKYARKPTTIAQLFRNKRMEEGKKNTELAKELGVDLASVYRWQRDDYHLSIETRNLILGYLGYKDVLAFKDEHHQIIIP